MEQETRTIERDLLDARSLRLLGNGAADGGCRGLVAGRLQIALHRFLRGRRGRDDAITFRRDDLRVEVLVRAVHRQARHGEELDVRTRLLGATQTLFVLLHDASPGTGTAFRPSWLPSG